VRRLRGEYPKDAPPMALAGKPKKPEHLTPVAAEKWDEMCKLLRARGVLTKADGPALELFCETWSQWRALLTDIAERGHIVENTVLTSNGSPITKYVANPAVKLASQKETAIRNMLREFSATPATREKTKPAKVKTTPKPTTKPFKAEDALSPDAIELLARMKKKEPTE